VIDTLETAVAIPALSLAIDSGNVLHVSYYVSGTGEHRYGTWEAGSWTSELVAPGGTGSIAVTPSGEPSIAYVALDTLRLAERTPQGWMSEVADSLHAASGLPAIGLRSDGRPHLTYVEGFDWTSQYVRHATRAVSGWADERLSMGRVEADEGGDLSIGSDDFPQAAFHELYTSEKSRLVVTTFDGASWGRETVDSAGYGTTLHEGIQLDLDAANRPHVAYLKLECDFESCVISARYAFRNESGTWTKLGIETVFSAWYTNENNWMQMRDVAVDPAGTAHCLYLKGIDSTGVQGESLFVAHRAGSTWVKECVFLDDAWDAALQIAPDGTFYVLLSRPAPAYGLYLARRVELTDVAGGPRPTGQLRLAVSPNPMRRGGTLSFALDGGGSSGSSGASGSTGAPSPAATISIYDIRGRAMRSFETAAPFGALSWDGADASGRPLAPGVYFIRLNDGGRGATTRVTIVK